MRQSSANIETITSFLFFLSGSQKVKIPPLGAEAADAIDIKKGSKEKEDKSCHASVLLLWCPPVLHMIHI